MIVEGVVFGMKITGLVGQDEAQVIADQFEIDIESADDFGIRVKKEPAGLFLALGSIGHLVSPRGARLP